MLTMYGAWIEGSTEADIDAIRRSMEANATAEEIYGAEPHPAVPLDPRAGATKVPLEAGWGRLSWRKTKHFNKINGGADGTRTRDPRRDRPVF